MFPHPENIVWVVCTLHPLHVRTGFSPAEEGLINLTDEFWRVTPHFFLLLSVSFLPAAKRSARRHWACTQAARAWYVGVSGGLGWCPGKTSGRSASSVVLPYAPPIRWDRQQPRPPPHPGEWKGEGPALLLPVLLATPTRITSPFRLLVSL